MNVKKRPAPNQAKSDLPGEGVKQEGESYYGLTLAANDNQNAIV